MAKIDGWYETVQRARLMVQNLVIGSNFAAWIEKQTMPLEVAREVLELETVTKDLRDLEEILNTEINGG